MADSPGIDRYWAGKVAARIEALTGLLERERHERLAQDAARTAQFTEDRKERKTYNESVRNGMEAQTEAARTFSAKVEVILPEVRAHAELIDKLIKSRGRLDQWEPAIKAYANSRLEALGRAKLAKGGAAVWGAIGAAVMFALTWLIGGHFPKS